MRHVLLSLAFLVTAVGCGSEDGVQGKPESLEQLIGQLQSEGQHETYPTASVGDVLETENEIGHALPESYKRFVTDFSNGAYLFGVQEVSAVGAGNEQIAAIQSIQRDPPSGAGARIRFHEGGTTEYERLIPFGLDYMGNEWCFIVEPGRPDNEYRVAYFDPSTSKLYGTLEGFGEWLSILVANQDEVIRTLYADDEKVSSELGLG